MTIEHVAMYSLPSVCMPVTDGRLSARGVGLPLPTLIWTLHAYDYSLETPRNLSRGGFSAQS